MALKESTRKLVLEKRDAIPADQRVKKSQRICDQLTQIALQHVGESSNASRNGLFIAAYEPMRNEVDVHPFFREAFARGWHVCLPCMAKDAESAKARMVFFELSETRIFDERPAFLDHPARPFLLANLHAQGWHEIDEVLFDIAVIPMVAFDSTDTAAATTTDSCRSCAPIALLPAWRSPNNRSPSSLPNRTTCRSPASSAPSKQKICRLRNYLQAKPTQRARIARRLPL